VPRATLFEITLVGNRARPRAGIHVVLGRSNSNQSVKLHQCVRDLAGRRSNLTPAHVFVSRIGRMQNARVSLEAGWNNATHARRKCAQPRSDPRGGGQVVSLHEPVGGHPGSVSSTVRVP
jgi:hypothetical protein